MATIVVQAPEGDRVKDGKAGPLFRTATVGSSPGRLFYATINGIPRTLERVGLDSSGNEIYRDQTRY